MHGSLLFCKKEQKICTDDDQDIKSSLNIKVSNVLVKSRTKKFTFKIYNTEAR